MLAICRLFQHLKREASAYLQSWQRTQIWCCLFWFHFHFLVMLCHNIKCSGAKFCTHLHWDTSCTTSFKSETIFGRAFTACTAKSIVSSISDKRSPEKKNTLFVVLLMIIKANRDLMFSSLTVKISAAARCQLTFLISWEPHLQLLSTHISLWALVSGQLRYQKAKYVLSYLHYDSLDWCQSRPLFMCLDS